MNTHTLVETGNRTFCKLHYRKIPGPVNLPALSHLFSRQGFCAILGGNAAVADAGRFTCWTAWPVEVFEFFCRPKRPLHKITAGHRKIPSAQPVRRWAAQRYFHGRLGRVFQLRTRQVYRTASSNSDRRPGFAADTVVFL